jgi:endonuclease-3
MNPAKRRAIFETLRRLNPHPRTELEYSTPYELLVAVVLSADISQLFASQGSTSAVPPL